MKDGARRSWERSWEDMAGR